MSSSPLLPPEQLFAHIDAWLDLSAQLPPTTEDSSPLAGDAKRSPVHRVDNAAWSAITYSIDHLAAVKALVIDAEVLHPFASFSLLRAAIENAATAVWLLAPSDRKTRLERRLRLAWNEVSEVGKASELIPTAFAGIRTAEERKDEVKKLAKTLDLDLSRVCGTFSYEKIVEAAGGASRLGGREAKVHWRVCSGFAHGRSWAMLGMLNRQEHPTADGDVAAVQLTTSVEQVATMTHVPFSMTNHALHLFERRRRSPYS
ncbi:hypothetical protein [Geodermatophilus nigrescens]|uniref:hypothetical protein n=1 Tax=Geodermatophilus nigrescens TaxID=1070870 RepID=UPI00093497C3|nr:hypothetical protein [Geodermatophilus nigrescens]